MIIQQSIQLFKMTNNIPFYKGVYIHLDSLVLCFSPVICRANFLLYPHLKIFDLETNLRYQRTKILLCTHHS